MSLNAVEVARPRNFPNEVGGKNIAAVGDCRAIVAAKITGDLGKRRATGAAVGGIGGQAVRPGIGNVDHGVAGEALLQLRLQRRDRRRKGRGRSRRKASAPPACWSWSCR